MKLTYSKIFLTLFSCIGYFTVQAQEPASKNYTAADGLASNNIYSITQDKQGFMWFATDNGVSRFDGSKFKKFSTEDGLSDNSVLRVAEDSKGRLWFLTFSGKLSFYCNGKIYNPSNNDLLRKIKFTNAITNFFEDSKGNIWISCVDRIVIRVSKDEQVTTYRNMESRAIMEGGNCIVYSLPSRGKCSFKGTEFTYKEMGFQLLCALLLPGDSSALMTTGNGFATYNLFNDTYYYNTPLYEYKAANTLGMFTDKGKNIWLSSLNGVTKFDKGIIAPQYEHDLFKNYSITNIFNDRDNNMWFSSIGSGVFMIPSLQILLFDNKSGLVENNISSLNYIGKNLLMVGTHNGSIQIVDHNNIKKKNQSLIPPTGSILKIINDKKGYTWVLTSQALFKYENGKFIIEGTHSWNKTIFTAHDGSLWMGWGRGLKRITASNVQMIFEDSVANRFYAIEEINNDLFFGSDKGLYRYHNGEIFFEGAKDTLLRCRINSLAVSDDSALWIATDAHGVICIDHGISKSYTVNDHLLSNHCNNILADGNKLYVCTDKGLNVISKENNGVHIASYSAANGLISSAINQIVKKATSIFLLATDHGIIEFDEKALPHPSPGSPYISDIIVNDVHILPFSPSRSFHYNENNIQIEFSSINFNTIGNPVYRYKLNGLDSGWNYSTSTSVKYSRLRPGNYSFIVAVQNVNGLWGAKTASLTFFIQTPWWQTWWFRTICLLTIAIVLGLLIWWRIKAYKKKIEQQKSMAESELKALRSQINPHFIYNSLNSIQDFIMQNQKEDANLYLAKFAKLMRNILSHSRNSKIALGEEIESLSLYLELESLRFNNQFTFSFETDKQINPEDVSIPSMIIQPYVENSVLHGLASRKEGGKITISFMKTGSYLVCSIEDNGIGRKKSQEIKQQKMWKGSKSLGMKITQERIDLLGIQEKQKIDLKIEDLMDGENNPSGTRVSIFFPVS